MICRLILAFLMTFGALQATANAFDQSSRKNDERRKISFDIKRNLDNTQRTESDDAQYLQQTPAAVFHISVATEAAPALMIISVLGFSTDDPKTFFPQPVPRLRLFKVLFPTIISPNAP